MKPSNNLLIISERAAVSRKNDVKDEKYVQTHSLAHVSRRLHGSVVRCPTREGRSPGSNPVNVSYFALKLFFKRVDKNQSIL